jgi:hypothetical protein
MTTDDRHSTCTMSDDDTLDPTDQQHRMAKVLATCMRAALHTARDKQVVLALLASAAGVDENWDAFRHMVESSAHNVVLDMAGDIDPGGEVAWQALAANMLAPMRSLT